MKVHELTKSFESAHSAVNASLKDMTRYLKEVKKAWTMKTTLTGKCEGFMWELNYVDIWSNVATAFAPQSSDDFGKG
jgi:hypothetical protein